MNSLIVCILLSVVVMANCQGQKSIFLTIENYVSSSGAELRAKCIKESGVPLEVVEKSEQNGEVSEDIRFKCYLRCSFVASNLTDSKGVINMDTLKSLLKASSPAFLDKIEKNCKQPTNDDLCESAGATCVCIFTMAHEEHIHA